jgi:hypothetical protein
VYCFTSLGHSFREDFDTIVMNSAIISCKTHVLLFHLFIFYSYYITNLLLHKCILVVKTGPSVFERHASDFTVSSFRRSTLLRFQRARQRLPATAIAFPATAPSTTLITPTTRRQKQQNFTLDLALEQNISSTRCGREESQAHKRSLPENTGRSSLKHILTRNDEPGTTTTI